MGRLDKCSERFGNLFAALLMLFSASGVAIGRRAVMLAGSIELSP